MLSRMVSHSYLAYSHVHKKWYRQAFTMHLIYHCRLSLYTLKHPIGFQRSTHRQLNLNIYSGYCMIRKYIYGSIIQSYQFDRTRGNGFKEGRLGLDVRGSSLQRVMRCCNRLPREVGGAPSLEVFKTTWATWSSTRSGGGLDLDDPWGLFQHKPFCDSLNCYGSSTHHSNSRDQIFKYIILLRSAFQEQFFSLVLVQCTCHFIVHSMCIL